ncbi:hypothetical protein [Streptomyces sp. NPDC086777]|uniref:hypothetical protein n=1 Tax=Streptomyces sp. NPDC086777 TaxID=3154866 RepID=UPI003450BB40
MVSRSVWQRLLDWLQPQADPPDGTEPAGAAASEVLMAQAIQDPAQAQNLIAIEKARTQNAVELETARGRTEFRMLALRGLICLLGLLIVAAAAVFVMNRAASLKLPLPAVGTSSLTMGGAGLLSGLVWWGKRALGRRRVARASAGSPSGSRVEGDQDPGGTP